MRKVSNSWFHLVCLIFEKYGYEVIPSNDHKTLWVIKTPDLAAAIPFTKIEEILDKEELGDYIVDILPTYLNSWKIVVS